jgi:hypothetical protein
MHISVSSGSFGMILYSIWQCFSPSFTSRRDERSALARSVAMAATLPEGGYEEHHTYLCEFWFVWHDLIFDLAVF